MSNPNHYPAKKSLWAIAFSASLSLAGVGIQVSGADSLASHSKAKTDYCIPHSPNIRSNEEVGPVINTLANIIAKIRRGQSVEVTSEPISVVERSGLRGRAYPIVFELKGDHCMAFTNDDPIANYGGTTYAEAQSIYTVTTEPVGDVHISSVEAAAQSSEPGVLVTQNGLIVGWAETKYTNPGCTFESCPNPEQ